MVAVSPIFRTLQFPPVIPTFFPRTSPTALIQTFFEVRK